jgi:hypothetical protein
MNRFFFRYVFWIPVLAALLIFSSPALASGDIPDLRGTWAKPNNTDSIRENIDFDSSEAEPPISYQIDKQHGRHFEGKTVNGRRSERLIGVISPDNESFHAVDDHRIIIGKILSPSEIEICHHVKGRSLTLTLVNRLGGQ